MKSIIATIVAVVLLLSSCNNNSRECYMYTKPSIYYVGFDSTDFETIYFEKYKNCCDFDTLISRDTIHFSDLKTNIMDTFWHPLMSISTSLYDYEYPDYNYKIILQNKREIQISNIQYEKRSCIQDPGSAPNPDCFCGMKSLEIHLINCTYSKFLSWGYYIHK